MPEGRPLMPRIRMPKLTRPGRSSRAASETTTTSKPMQAETAEKAEKAEKAGTTPATKEAQPPAANPAVGATTPEPNLQERIEGLQGWMAEIERKQARITYFGGLALLLALGAAGAALYFGLTTQSDSAKKSDLSALTNRVKSLEGAVTKNSKDTQNALNASIAQLQQSISGVQKRQSEQATKISTLQSQIASGALNKNVAPGVAPTTPPGAAPTPTTPANPKKP
jgi:uncharacterized protein HemX